MIPVSSLSLRRQLLSSAWEVEEMTTKDHLVTTYVSAVLVEQTSQCAIRLPQTVNFMQTLGTDHYKLFYMGQCNIRHAWTEHHHITV